MLRYISIFAIGLFFSCRINAQPVITLEPFALGLSNPVDIENAHDDRLFIVERLGYIKIVDALGNVNPVNFLDIHNEVEAGYQEQGLLGLAFHPDYAGNGYFYVYYTDVDGNTVVSRFSVSAGEPNIADPASEQILFTAVQPYLNHNGGCIKFGPDGYLYIGLGDGGSAGDPGNRAQNPMNKLGKMMRIDVDGAFPYAIPADNPFATATDTLQEIWAMGYRNPWRYSFDALTGNMWIGDVGQNLHEEIDFENALSGGHNYGWRCYEGFSTFDLAGCDADTTYVFPVFDYPHNYTTGGYAVTGGFVYRGADYPGMFGYYICADYVSGNWWWVNADAGVPWTHELLFGIQTDISAFGVDMNNELYCSDLDNGTIYRVEDACGDYVISTVATDYICGVQDGSVDLSITAGTAPFDFNWSDGSTTEDISGLDPGTYNVTVTDGTGCQRTSTAIVNDIPPFTAVISVTGINTLTATPGVVWQWYVDGTLIGGATDAVYVATADGSYNCYVTDANGCSEWSNTIDMIVNAINSIAGINDFKLYPDPVADHLNFEFNSTMNYNDVTFSVEDITGKKINSVQLQIHTGLNSFSLKTDQLAEGIYLLRMNAEGMITTGNFVVVK